jgi:hypothetical protein
MLERASALKEELSNTRSAKVYGVVPGVPVGDYGVEVQDDIVDFKIASLSGEPGGDRFTNTLGV